MPPHTPPAPPPKPPDPAADREGDLDEVGFAIGPDEGGGGLFDRSGSDSTGTGESTASTVQPGAASAAQRTALLAWLAADLPAPEAPEESTEPGQGPATSSPPAPQESVVRLQATIRRALADEPLDPLPALDGIGMGVWPEVSPGTLPDEGSTTALLTGLTLPPAPTEPVATQPLTTEPLTTQPSRTRPAPFDPPRVGSTPPPSAAAPRPPRSPTAAIRGLDLLLAAVVLSLGAAYLFAAR